MNTPLSPLTCQITARLSPEEVCGRLASVTESEKAGASARRSFVGTISSPDGFCITPALAYRNSFRPILTGKLSASGDETRVAVTAQMHPFPKVILCLWFGLLCLCGLLTVFSNNAEKQSALLFCFGCIAAGLALIQCFYRAPAKKALKTLRELLE